MTSVETPINTQLSLEKMPSLDEKKSDVPPPADLKSRRRPGAPRKIPRKAETPDPKGSRKGKSASPARHNRNGSAPHRRRRRTVSEMSAMSENHEASPLRKLREAVMTKHERKGLNLLNSYIKNRMELAKFDNTASFLQHCQAMEMVPEKYRLKNSHIKNTKYVERTLDRFSFQIMGEDLKYQRKRRLQVNKLLVEKVERMRETFELELFEDIVKVMDETFERKFLRIKEQQAKLFESLVQEYKLTDKEREEGELRLKELQQRDKEREERRALEREKRLKEKELEGSPSKKEVEGSPSKKEDAAGDESVRTDSTEGKADEPEATKAAE